MPLIFNNLNDNEDYYYLNLKTFGDIVIDKISSNLINNINFDIYQLMLIIEKLKLNLIPFFTNNNIDDFFIEVSLTIVYQFDYQLNDNYNIINPNI